MTENLAAGHRAPSGRRRVAQRIVVAALWIGAVVAWRVYQHRTGMGTTDTLQRFVDRVGSAWWGVAAYLGVYLARPLVLFPATLLTVAGGLIFGPAVGIGVVIIGANASAMVAYGVGRLVTTTPGANASGPSPAGDAASTARAGLAARWAERMRQNSFESILVMRLLFLPYDLVNYTAGLLRIGWVPFLGATAIGSLPGTVSFVLLGASLERVDEGIDGLDPTALVVSVALIVASIAGSRWLRRRQSDGGEPTVGVEVSG
jgi:uncharacterized membrane protein YdjX (TVP38/TMEM64 family)